LRLPHLLASEFPEVRGRVKLLPNGPPVPHPVQFRVVGRDAAQVRHWADEAQEILRSDPRMRGVNDDWNESVNLETAVGRARVGCDGARWQGATTTRGIPPPDGFVALLGVIASMGMIMRNSVILIDQIDQIDQIEQDRRHGVPTWDAIVESAVRRFRPIVLTAAAAVLAMIPLSRRVFWGPMAVAIMAGLAVATVLTLLALPAMYAAWFRVKREDAVPPSPTIPAPISAPISEPT